MKKMFFILMQLFIVSILFGQEKIVFPRSTMNKNAQLIYSNPGSFCRSDEIMLGCSRIFPWLVTDSTLCKNSLYASYTCGKRVYVDINGNLALRNVYMDARPFAENMAAVEVDDKWGFIDTLGNMVIQAKYEYAGDFSGGRALVNEGGKEYYINHKGEQASLNLSRRVNGNDSWSVFADSDDKDANGTRYAFTGENNNMITRYIYEGYPSRPEWWYRYQEWWYRYQGINCSDLIRAKRGGKWGYINVKTLNEDIPFVYDYACDFSEGLACVVKGNKYGYINEKGQVVIPIVYDKGPVEGEGEDEVFSVVNGFVALWKANKCGFVDKKGHAITQFIYDGVRDFQEERAAVCKDNKWGFIDGTGRMVVAPLYDDVGDYFFGGYACVKQGKKFGAIDKNGKIVIPFKYDSMEHLNSNIYPDEYPDELAFKASKFNEKCFSVKSSGKWCVIDIRGNIIVPFVYSSVEFNNGYAVVEKNEKYGIIDSTGNLVVPCVHNKIGDYYHYQSDLLPYKMRARINPKEQIFEIFDGEGEDAIRYYADIKGNFYMVPFSASQYADYYADVKMNGFWSGDKGWMERGQFEKTDDYQKRTDPQTCALKVSQFKEEARKFYLGLVKLGTQLIFSIGDYDADNECFSVHENCFGDSRLSVPIKDAQSFKKIWNESSVPGARMKIEATPEYRLNGEHVDLASVTFSIVSDVMDTVKYHTISVFKYAGDGYRKSLHDSNPYGYANSIQREADEVRKKVEERKNEQENDLKKREEIKKKQETLAADSAKVAYYAESMEEYMDDDDWEKAEETAQMLYSNYSTILTQNRKQLARVYFIKAYAFFKRNLDFKLEADTDASAYFKAYRDEAESLAEKCTQSISFYPNYSNQAYFYRGIAYIILNYPENAASDFRAAMEGDASQKGLCYYNIGISYENNRWYNDAIAQFKLARSCTNDDKLSKDALDEIKNCQEKLNNK